MFKLKSRCILFVALISIILIFNQPLFSDTRKENIDIVIALDKSLSMVEEIQAVKNYVNHYIVNQLIIPNDYLLIVGFYGKTEVLVSQFVRNEQDKRDIVNVISSVKADGHFTDIGNALDVLRDKLANIEKDGRRKYVLLITDGKQEAPPGSKYYSPDGKFNHEFLKNAKIIQKKGWKIEILGIGKLPATEELAKTISGGYTEISKQPTEKERKEKTKTLLSMIQVTEMPKQVVFSNNGKGEIKVKLKGVGYNQPINLKLSNFKILIPNASVEEVHDGNFLFTVKPNEEKIVKIPLTLSNPPKPGRYRGTILLSFAGKTRLVPSTFDLDIRVNSFLQSYWWLILLLAILLLIGLALVLAKVLGSRGSTRGMKIQLVVEELPTGKAKSVINIKEKTPVFLNMVKDNITLSDKLNPSAIAKLTLIGERLKLSSIKDKYFEIAKNLSENILNKSFKVKTDTGKDFHIRIKSVK